MCVKEYFLKHEYEVLSVCIFLVAGSGRVLLRTHTLCVYPARELLLMPLSGPRQNANKHALLRCQRDLISARFPGKSLLAGRTAAEAGGWMG